MDSPYKGLFAFSRKEQIGLIFFLSVILICLLTIRFQEFMFPVPEPQVVLLDSAWLYDLDSIHLKNSEGNRERFSIKETKPRLADPVPFDPNSISLEGLVNLGFSLKQAESIERYRSKGGRFKEKEDFKKMYVVNDFMFDRLEAFIQITPSNELQEKMSFEKESGKEIPMVNKNAMAMLELNSADSTQLDALPGIGPVFAKRILEYRDKLGGFSSVDQLKEVYGMDRYPEVVEQVLPHVFISSKVLKPIDVNKAQWVDLVRHPYIEKSIANSIIAIREQHGPYKSVDEIKRSHLISEDLYRKLEPYLIVSQ